MSKDFLTRLHAHGIRSLPAGYVLAMHAGCAWAAFASRYLVILSALLPTLPLLHTKEIGSLEEALLNIRGWAQREIYQQGVRAGLVATSLSGGSCFVYGVLSGQQFWMARKANVHLAGPQALAAGTPL